MKNPFSRQGFLHLYMRKKLVIIVLIITLSLVTKAGAYSFRQIYGTNKYTKCGARNVELNRGSFSAPIAFRCVVKRIICDREKRFASGNFFFATQLFSSSSDVAENEGENETNTKEATEPISNSVPNLSATSEDIDFMSVNDIDWAEMDPLHEIPFEEYEELYLLGKAKSTTVAESNPNCDDSYESIMTEWDDSVPTLNHISLVGRVGNLESRYFDNPLGTGSGSGTSYKSNKPNVVVSMSLALPRYYSPWEREQYGIVYGQEETEWYNLEVWGFLAEFALKNIQKGSRIGVVGSIDMDYYRNKQTGLLSCNPKVLVQDLDVLESKMEADARRKNSFRNNSHDSDEASYNSNSNTYGEDQKREQERGPSFFTDDDDEDDLYDSNKGADGLAGGFFDPL